MTRAVACLSLVLVAGLSQRAAAGLTAVSPLPDYRCEILDITTAQANDPAFTVPILARPDPKSPVLSNTAGLVIVHSPETRVNGYLQVLAFSGTPGWIAPSAVRPYAIPGPAWCTMRPLTHVGRQGRVRPLTPGQEAPC